MKDISRQKSLQKKSDILHINDQKKLLTDNPELESTFSLLRTQHSDSAAILEKVKLIFGLILNRRKYDSLMNKCFMRSNGGKKVKVGSAVFHEFRVISISTDSYSSLRHTILAKFFLQNDYIKNAQVTITAFALKRAKLRPECWENNAEINILGPYGREYIVKISFFTYN